MFEVGEWDWNVRGGMMGIKYESVYGGWEIRVCEIGGWDWTV